MLDDLITDIHLSPIGIEQSVVDVSCICSKMIAAILSKIYGENSDSDELNIVYKRFVADTYMDPNNLTEIVHVLRVYSLEPQAPIVICNRC